MLDTSSAREGSSLFGEKSVCRKTLGFVRMGARVIGTPVDESSWRAVIE
jgi:hypothetical protein